MVKTGSALHWSLLIALAVSTGCARSTYRDKSISEPHAREASAADSPSGTGSAQAAAAGFKPFTLGRSDAPIKIGFIFAYSDDRSSTAHQILRDLIVPYKDKVTMVFVPVADESFSAKSIAAAYVAYLANKQGRYLDAHKEFIGKGSHLAAIEVVSFAERLGVPGRQIQVASQSPISANAFRTAAETMRRMGCASLPCVGINDQVISGLERPERYREALEAALKIPDGRIAFGTGFPIAEGYIVTNYHVIRGARGIALRTADGKAIAAQVALADEQNDLALLQPESLELIPPALPLSRTLPKLASEVFTIGYPLAPILGSSAKYSPGAISSLGAGMDPRMYQISAPIQRGNSGGPLLNDRGEVIGVVNMKAMALPVFKMSGDMPENIAFALKLSVLEPLIKKLPDRSQKLPQVIYPAKTREEIADKVRLSVVQVLIKLE